MQNRKATDPEMLYCQPIHASLFGVQLYMKTKLTHLMTAYYLPNDGFKAMDASFIMTKLGSYTTLCSVFSIQCTLYMVILELLMTTTLLLREFAAKQH